MATSISVYAGCHCEKHQTILSGGRWMASDTCCYKDRAQAVFPDPVIPATMQIKGCSKWNRSHFCEDIGTVWNGVKPALRCLDIKCLCILSFLLKYLSQEEQDQLMSTPQEQNVDWKKVECFALYTFGKPRHSIADSSFFSSSSSSFLFSPSKSFYKRTQVTTISSFCSNVSRSEEQPWFSSTVTCLSSSSAPVSFTDSHSTTTTCISPNLIQCT